MPANFAHRDDPRVRSVSDFLLGQLRDREYEMQWYCTKSTDATPELIAAYEASRHFAEGLIRYADSLGSPELQIDIGQLLDAPMDAKVIGVELIHERLARVTLQMQKSAEASFLSLVQVARGCRRTEMTDRFLGRVSRCYLFGFTDESLIMCRAALEEELQAQISYDEIEAKGILNRKTRRVEYTPYGMLEAASRPHPKYPQRIQVATCERAHKLRKDANDLLHDGKPPEDDPIEYIKTVMAVLADLEGPES
jgi:hypothetical protein